MTLAIQLSTVSMDRRGSGSPVVLVHGLGSRWQLFAPVVDRIAARHDVLSVDLPGFGASAPDARFAPGAVGYAEWLAVLLDDLGIERPHVVGSSLGGGVALEMGRSGSAGRVTAFSPIGFWGRPGVLWTQTLLTSLRTLGSRARPALDLLMEHPATRGVALAPLFGHPTRVGAAEARADLAALVAARSFREARDSFGDYVLGPDQDLGRLRDIPVTIAWGTRDVTLVHRTQSRRAREVLPFARHVDLPGCGHLPFNDDPGLCARVVLDEPGEEWARAGGSTSSARVRRTGDE